MKKWARDCNHDGKDHKDGEWDTDCDLYKDYHDAMPAELWSVKVNGENDADNSVNRTPGTNQEVTGIEKVTEWWSSNTTPHKVSFDDQQQKVMQGGIDSP